MPLTKFSPSWYYVPMAKALLMVDVNVFFLQDAPEGFADKLKSHAEHAKYDLIAFTVFRNTPESNFARSLNWTKCSSKEDAELPSQLKPFVNENNVFEKDTNSAFAGTGLQEYLKSNNISEIELCGMDTHACVLASAFSAFDLGYKVHVNFDLTFSSKQLEKEARAIIRESILPQDKQQQ